MKALTKNNRTQLKSHIPGNTCVLLSNTFSPNTGLSPEFSHMFLLQPLGLEF